MTRASRLAGIGLRAMNMRDFQALRPRVGFVEIHAENHLCGGAMRRALHGVRADYDISVHCVGLSIGTAGGLDHAHLRAVCALADEIDPFLISDHLSVSTLDGVFTNDLLPLSYTEEALGIACAHVSQIQDALGRQLLIENPSRYLAFKHATIGEGAFMAELAQRTGCGVLLDVNNVFVTALNMGEDPLTLLRSFARASVKQLHLAGHATTVENGESLRIDTHDRVVCEEVWDLYASTVDHFGAHPTLIEWDDALPPLPELVAEADKATAISDARLSELAHAVAR